MMKKTSELSEKKAPAVRVNKELNKYNDVILFPDKVKKAKKTIEKFGLPGPDSTKKGC